MSISRLSVVVALFSVVLSACGGSGSSTPPAGGSPAPTPPPFAPVVATSIEGGLLGTGSTIVASTATMFGSAGPTGAVPYSAASEGSPLYALNAAGEVVLAGTIINGRAALSAESTVLTLARQLLRAQVAAPSTIDATLRGKPAFALSVEAFTAAFNKGLNPVSATEFRAPFSALLDSVIEDDRKSASASTALKTAGLPDNRVDPVADSLPLPSGGLKLLKLPIASSAAGGTVAMGQRTTDIVIRNSTPVHFLVDINDVNDVERHARVVLGGAGLSASFLGVGEQIRIPKGFAGSFAVELNADRAENLVALLMQMLGAATGLSGDHGCTAAVRAGVLQGGAFSTLLVGESASTLAANAGVLMEGAVNILVDCVSGLYAANTERALLERGARTAASVLRWQAVLADLAPIAYHVDAYYKATALPQPHRVGVCVSRAEIAISCLARMQLGEGPGAVTPPPMAPRAVYNSRNSRGSIQLLDHRNQPTAVPADLVVLQSSGLEGIIEFSVGDYFPGEGLSFSILAIGGEGEGVVTLLDPATGISLDVPVKVSRGRFEPSQIEVLETTLSQPIRLLERGGSRPLLLPLGGLWVTTWTPPGKAHLQSFGQSDGSLVFQVSGIETHPQATVSFGAKGFGEIASLGVEVLPRPQIWSEGPPTIRSTIFTCSGSSDPNVCPRGTGLGAHVYLAYNAAVRDVVGARVRLDPHTGVPWPMRMSCGAWTSLTTSEGGVTWLECRRDPGQPAATVLFVEAASSSQVTSAVSGAGGRVGYTAYASFEGDATIVEISSPSEIPQPSLP